MTLSPQTPEESEPFGSLATAYAEAGWAVFPLPTGAKKPPPRGYTGRGARVATAAELEKWAQANPVANVGTWAGGASWPLVGVDVDAYDGKRGDATLAELEVELGALPPTYTSSARGVDNPSGIRWYRLPEGREHVELAGIAGAAIELIQAKHRYGVLPPSLHPSGAAYRWRFGEGAGRVDYGPDVVPEVAELAELPLSWVERFAVAAGLPGSTSERAKGVRADGGGPDGREAERQWLRTHGAGATCRAVRGVLAKAVTELEAAVADGSSRYDVAVRESYALVLLAGEGHRGVRVALGSLRDRYAEAVAADGARSPDDVTSEWSRAVGEAVAKVVAVVGEDVDHHGDGLRDCPDRPRDEDGSNGGGDVDDHEWPSHTEPYSVAREFAQRHYWCPAEGEGEAGCYVLARWRGDFYAWRGARWVVLEEAELYAHLYRLLDEAVCWGAGDPPQLLRWRPTKAKLAAVVDALGAFVLRSSDLEAADGDGSISLLDGVLDTATGEFHAHHPARFNLTALPFQFGQLAHAGATPRWDDFLDDVFDGDAESKELLAEWYGYVVSGRTELQKVLMLLGPPRSGKGVITRTLEGLIGRDNVVAPTMHSLTQNFGLQPVIGKALAVIQDARFGGRDSDTVLERLLTVTGGDTLTIDRKNRDPWEGRLRARWQIVTNELPSLRDSSGAFTRRILGPLETTSEKHDDEIDPYLLDALLAELPGILRWALEGLARLDARGGVFTMPKASRATRRELAETVSPITGFIGDVLVVDADGEADSMQVYAAYRQWCDRNGQHPTASARFGRELKAALQGRLERVRGRRGDNGEDRFWAYRGITVRPRSRTQLDDL